MDLALTEEQEALRDAVARLLDKTSTPEHVREAEPLGWSAEVWDGFASIGVPTMGVADHGGATLSDLGVVAREAGSHLAPAPIVEAMVASRVLAGFGHPVDDERVRTIAVRPASGGRFLLVPGGAVAAEVVGLDGDRLVSTPTASPAPVANLGSAPLADVDVDPAAVVLATGDAAAEAHRRALDEWRVLTAQWLVGLGRAAFDIGVQYVRDRRQFGVPIGSFQAVQHRLADLATALDGTTLLVDKATWALEVGDPVAATFPAMAFSLAGDTAQQVAAASLHLHGGYGFMEEYDIQLHFRRAKAARLVLGDPRRDLQHLADRLFGPAEPAPTGGAV